MKKESLARKVVASVCSAALAFALMPAAAMSAFADDASAEETASTISSFTTTGTNSVTGSTYKKAVGGTSSTTIDSVTKTSDGAIYYLMRGKSTQIFKVTTYIEAKDLLGDGWIEGSTFNFDDRKKGDAMPYEYDSEGQFYPNFTYNASATAEDFSTEGAKSVPMILALDAETITMTDGQTAQEAIEAADKDDSWELDSKDARWMSGTPESMYKTQSLMAGNVFWTYDEGANITATLTYSRAVSALNSFTVNATNAKTGAVTSTTLSVEMINDMKQTNTESPLYYIMNGTRIYKVTTYLEATDLLDEQYWHKGSTFNFDDRKKGDAMPYEYDAEGCFYPNYTYNESATAEDFSTEDVYFVPMVMGLDTQYVNIADGQTAREAIEAATKDGSWQTYHDGICWMSGTPASLYETQTLMYGNVFWRYAAGSDVVANVTYTPEKAAQNLKVTAKKTVTVKAKKVAKKAQTVKAISKVAGAKGAVSYSQVFTHSAAKKYVKVNAKTGKLTVKKGAKKGTYTVKVKVSAKATTDYKAASKTVTIKVKVK